MSEILRVAANFAAFYYDKFVREPEALTAVYLPSAQITRGSQSARGDAASTLLRTLPVNKHRIVISSIEEQQCTEGRLHFLVKGQLVAKSITGHSEYFRQLFELKPQNSARTAFAIYSDTYRVDTDARPTGAWSAETPPMFASQPKEEDEPMPPIDVPAAVEEVEAPVVEEPVQAEEPAAEEVAPAVEQTAEPTEKAQFPEEAAEAEVKSEEPAPVEAAPVVEEAKDDKPSAPKSFADLVRGRSAPAPAKKEEPKVEAKKEEKKEEKKEAPVKKEAKTEKATPKKEDKKAKAEDKKVEKKVEEKKKPEEKKEEVKKAEEPKAEAKKEEEAPKAEEEKKEAPKPKAPAASAWSKGSTLSFAALAAAAPTADAASVMRVKATKDEPKEKKEEKKEEVKKEEKKERPAPVKEAKPPSNLAASVDHYHAFIKGLPNGTTEQELIDLFGAQGVPLRKGMKIESKNVKETVRDGTNTLTERVRTFGFVCIDAKGEDVHRHIETMKKLRLRLGTNQIFCDEVREKSVFMPKK